MRLSGDVEVRGAAAGLRVGGVLRPEGPVEEGGPEARPNGRGAAVPGGAPLTRRAARSAMAHFVFEADLHGLLKLDTPIPNAPPARWQRKAKESACPGPGPSPAASMSPMKPANRSYSGSKTPSKTPGKRRRPAAGRGGRASGAVPGRPGRVGRRASLASGCAELRAGAGRTAAPNPSAARVMRLCRDGVGGLRASSASCAVTVGNGPPFSVSPGAVVAAEPGSYLFGRSRSELGAFNARRYGGGRE